MDKKKFTFWNRIVALAVFLVAATTYLLTIEPTASFWDCGEFIASSYKLEVGHPPGNPVFQIFARIATIFTGPEHAALAINAMNALISALTILLLYLTTIFLVKRLVKPAADGTYSLSKAIVIMGSSAVGALVYTFSDTFWFSAVEGEVYAMSSLFTALVFWAMTKWYEQADEPYANRWLVLIAFLMGLSIGIHLLNLLTIPALVFMFYYRKREDLEYTPLQLLGIFGVSVAILAFILYGVIPYLPQLAASFDRVFVNNFGLPFNSGAAFFMLLLLGLCFWGIYKSLRAKKVLLNTALLCFTMIVIGFSVFAVVIIRSSAKTPTNEYQPDNPYTLIRYLGREQYGSNPLIYGQAWESPYDLKETEYWARIPGVDEYVEKNGPEEPEYYSEGKMFFPRMWSSQPSHVEFYKKKYLKNPIHKTYKDSDGKKREFVMPSFSDNMHYFFDFQMNWMYWRYFMWNFAGRQNEIHGAEPNSLAGNWECGIDFIDKARLGDQSNAPGYLADNKGKNHYYMLPLLLGLLGIFYQCYKDKRGAWVTFLMFFMTGIAIVIYLNQPPYQVRERDYAYAGSFYTFSIWIGLGVAGLFALVRTLCNAVSRKNSCATFTACTVTALSLCVPTLMAVENWDDHDRSNRYTAVEVAKNYLNSVGENGILITHGDNDTFPLWYAQEVESVRTDVRVVNTSLLGTDWHIDQMRWAVNKSAPLKLAIDQEKYLYGTNEFMYVHGNTPRTAESVIEHVKKDDKRLYLVAYHIPELDINPYWNPDYEKDPSSIKVEWAYVGAKKDINDLRVDLLNDDEFCVSSSPEYMSIKEYIEQEDLLGRHLDYTDIRILQTSEVGPYIPTRKIIVPVNKDNILESGILHEKYAGEIPENIVLRMPSDKHYITKPELFMLDLIANYEWDRPINMLSMGGDINIGLKEYLMYEGFSYKFVPIMNKMSSSDIGFSDPYDLYDKMKNVFTWDALKRPDYFVDYQNLYTFCGVLPQRQIFVNVAKELLEVGEREKALEIVDMCMECVPAENYPYDLSAMGFLNEYWVKELAVLYLSLGEREKGLELLRDLVSQLRESMDFLGTDSAEYENVRLNMLRILMDCQADVDILCDIIDSNFSSALGNFVEQYCTWLSDDEVALLWNQIQSFDDYVTVETVDAELDGSITTYADALKDAEAMAIRCAEWRDEAELKVTTLNSELESIIDKVSSDSSLMDELRSEYHQVASELEYALDDLETAKNNLEYYKAEADEYKGTVVALSKLKEVIIPNYIHYCAAITKANELSSDEMSPYKQEAVKVYDFYMSLLAPSDWYYEDEMFGGAFSDAFSKSFSSASALGQGLTAFSSLSEYRDLLVSDKLNLEAHENEMKNLGNDLNKILEYDVEKFEKAQILYLDLDCLVNILMTIDKDLQPLFTPFFTDIDDILVALYQTSYQSSDRLYDFAEIYKKSQPGAVSQLYDMSDNWENLLDYCEYLYKGDIMKLCSKYDIDLE